MSSVCMACLNIWFRSYNQFRTQLLELWQCLANMTISHLFWYNYTGSLWYRIVFKILLIIYKSLNGFCPPYLSSCLEYRKSSQSLRSVSNELLLVPTSNYKTYGDRPFAVCAPKFWNNCPMFYEIRLACHFLKGICKIIFLIFLLIVILYIIISIDSSTFNIYSQVIFNILQSCK